MFSHVVTCSSSSFIWKNMFDKRKHMYINQGNLTEHAQVINAYQHIEFCPENSCLHKRFWWAKHAGEVESITMHIVVTMHLFWREQIIRNMIRILYMVPVCKEYSLCLLLKCQSEIFVYAFWMRKRYSWNKNKNAMANDYISIFIKVLVVELVYLKFSMSTYGVRVGF